MNLPCISIGAQLLWRAAVRMLIYERSFVYISRMVTTDGRLARGERARSGILAEAADIGSAEGLEGLSIGRLALKCGTSKSNIAAHFGSKAQLQLAAIDYAAEVFMREVIAPAMAAPEGLARLVALYECWMDYSRRRVFSGGCFFAAVTGEYDARDGAIRDALREQRRKWIGLQEQLVTAAISSGDLSGSASPAQVVFELDAFAQAANSTAVLYDDDTAYDRALAAIHSRIDSIRAVKEC